MSLFLCYTILMTPKNIPLFHASLATGLIGVWLFTFTLYWLQQDLGDRVGANIGAGLVGLLSWLVGFASLVLFILSYIIKPKT